MEPYDVLLVKGRSPVARIIEAVTQSPYSHAAIVLDDRHLLETSWNYPLKIRHISYRLGNFDVYRYPGLTPAQKEKIRAFYLSVLGQRYDYLQLVTHGLYLLAGIPIINASGRYICTEVIDKGFKAAGIDLLPGNSLASRTPADLGRSKLQKIPGAAP